MKDWRVHCLRRCSYCSKIFLKIYEDAYTDHFTFIQCIYPLLSDNDKIEIILAGIANK